MLAPSRIVLVLGLLLGADKPAEDAAKKELEKLQGTWRFVSLEQSGKKVPDEKLQPLRVLITGDRFVFKNGERTVEETILKPDPSKKPAAIDIKATAGPRKGKVHLGIYELAGDTLKMCWSPPDKERPMAFTTQADSGQFLVVLHREKP
jgi:uncharacterized protein (TIGR03067 family)